FVDLFGKFLKLDNILQNYDDFVRLQAVQMLDFENPEEVAAFQAKYQMDIETMEKLAQLPIPTVREIQDYRSAYNDIRDWYTRERQNQQDSKSTVDWDSVVFEVELLKSQEINLD
ncbi:type I restriction endonuclease subunit R, EcoR124 family, partial [Streptococcus suis]